MKARSGPVASRVIAGVMIGFGILGLVVWRALQPRIQTASMEEIRAILPQEILVTASPDPVGEKRYRRLATLCGRTTSKDWSDLFNSKLAPGVREKLAINFWNSNPKLMLELDQVLKEGDLRYLDVPHEMNQPAMFSSIKSMTKTLALSSLAYAKEHKYAQSRQMISLALRLSDSLRNSNGTLITYLVAVATEAITSKAIFEMASLPGIPAEECKGLLDIIPATPIEDSALAPALRTDFQQYVLKVLPDPREYLKSALQDFPITDEEPAKPEPLVGSYDAIETAKLYGKIVQIEQHNAIRTLAEFDPTGSELVEKADKSLPRPVRTDKVDDFSKQLDKIRYRLEMNSRRNSLGKLLLTNVYFGDRTTIEASARWRGYRDVLRILLASKVYRSSHSGKLPKSSSELASLLGTWPRDPFNGKPIVYRADKETAYCVGPDLRDDGGQIQDVRKSPDLGVWLKR